MININIDGLDQDSLVTYVEGQMVVYENHKQLTANSTAHVYNTIGGRELQKMSRSLERALFMNPSAQATKAKVDKALAEDYGIGVEMPVKKIKSMYELHQEANHMSMNKFYGMKPVR